jgi:hypothetical protein
VDETLFGAVFEKNVSASSYSNVQISPTTSALEQGVTIESTDTSVAVMNGNVLERVAPGIGRAVVTSGENKQFVRSNMLGNQPAISRLLKGAVDDSMHDVLSRETLALLNADKTTNLFSVWQPNATPPVVTYDPNCWAYGLDFSSSPVATMTTAINGVPTWSNRNRGYLITPRHLYGVGHYNITYPYSSVNAGYLVGCKFMFKGISGDLYIREAIGRDYKWLGDCVVVTLDQDLPEDVSVCEFAGSWCEEIVQPPVPRTNGQTVYQAGMAIQIGTLSKVTCNFMNSGYPANANANRRKTGPPVRGTSTLKDGYIEEALYKFFTPQGIPGDSGSPWWYLVNGELIGAWFDGDFPGGIITTANDFVYPDSVGEKPADLMIAAADADAIARGSMTTATGYTVTIAPDPTL